MKSNEQIIAEVMEEKRKTEEGVAKFRHTCILENFPDAIHIGGRKYTLAGYEFASDGLGYLTDGETVLYRQANLADWLVKKQNPSQWERFKNFFK